MWMCCFWVRLSGNQTDLSERTPAGTGTETVAAVVTCCCCCWWWSLQFWRIFLLLQPLTLWHPLLLERRECRCLHSAPGRSWASRWGRFWCRTLASCAASTGTSAPQPDRRRSGREIENEGQAGEEKPRDEDKYEKKIETDQRKKERRKQKDRVIHHCLSLCQLGWQATLQWQNFANHGSFTYIKFQPPVIPSTQQLVDSRKSCSFTLCWF